MRILIAPDSFKNSLPAEQVAEAIATGIRTANPEAQLTLLPLADGGEGTLDVLARVYPNAVWKSNRVSDPLERPIESQWLWLPDSQTAIIELARSAGIHLLSEEERRPLETSTYGVGQQIVDALSYSPAHIIIALGGSATVDGGTGIARALGYRFLDSNGCELPAGGGPLIDLAAIDRRNVRTDIKNTRFSCMVDVDNPLLGNTGAAKIYGPQKGASPSQVLHLEKALDTLAKIASRDLNKSQIECQSGAGSAGGCPAGLSWFCNASWQPGAEMILDLLEIESIVEKHDLVITGEGCVDSQSLNGKLVYTLLQRIDNQVPVWVICGTRKPGYEPMMKQIHRLECIIDHAPSVPDALENAAKHLERIVNDLLHTTTSFFKQAKENK